MAVLTVTTRRESDLADATSVTLSDADGLIGIERIDTGEVVVAAGASFDRDGLGDYSYTFEPEVDTVFYAAHIKIAVPGGVLYSRVAFYVSPDGSISDASPAMIVQQLLSVRGLVSDPSLESPWPCYVSSLPDAVDEAVGVFDTTPVKDARLHEGPVIEHYGVMLRVRSTSLATGWEKIKSIASALDMVQRETVNCSGVNFSVQAITRTSGPAMLGQETTSSRRRYISTLNIILPVRLA